jgi:hypothetical protein
MRAQRRGPREPGLFSQQDARVRDELAAEAVEMHDDEMGSEARMASLLASLRHVHCCGNHEVPPSPAPYVVGIALLGRLDLDYFCAELSALERI